MTHGSLSSAIEERLGIHSSEARKYASTILDLFGFEDRIIVNTLTHKERRLFYRLEALGLLSTQRERITLHDGRQWRIHYWVLARKKILRYAARPWLSSQSTSSPSPETVYSYLSNDTWTSRNNTM